MMEPYRPIHYYHQTFEYVCVAEWLRSPPLMREGLGSTPGAGKIDSGYHPSEVGEMSSNY